MFENVDDERTTDGRWTTDTWLYYKFPYEPIGSGEVKIWKPKIVTLTVHKIEQFGDSKQ